VKTANATALALPTNMPVAPWRRTALEYPENEDRPMHPIYRYAFVGDAEEGLVLVNVDTLTDADPRNNFLERTPVYGARSYNPDGMLTGIRDVRIAGNLVYVLTERALVIVDFGDFGPEPATRPEPRPEILAVLAELEDPRALDLQFRYAFVADARGLAVVDVTDPAAPELVARAGPMADARNVYVARTYAYVAGGKEGVVIVDVERPDRPRIVERYDAGGKLDDVWDVKIGSTYANLYAYVADGHNGLRVLQLSSPDRTPGYLGFSPEPRPELIATRHTHGPARALSRGLDRDRAVDESGNQVAIFNRIGARPLNLEEMRALYLRDGEIYTVTDEPEEPLPAAGLARTERTGSVTPEAPAQGKEGNP
jgi:hypothetical protein